MLQAYDPGLSSSTGTRKAGVGRRLTTAPDPEMARRASQALVRVWRFRRSR
jgi:hypothetical protein